ncbi:MAG: SRPBCC family protein [Pseudomonadota bacterium]|nr:SRPBCC family protein [Pseudomonadota bacterium]MEE2821102.1 SRPBCC family protein [Pseudomonadota bacterium]
MRFERRLYASKPPEETLRLIADFRNLKAWDDSVQSVVARDGVFGQGSKYDVRVLFSGKPIDMVYTVTVYEPGVCAVLTGVAPKAIAIDRVKVATTGQGTQVDYVAEIRLAFPYNFLDPILAIGFKKTVDHAVAGLSRLLSE